MLENQLPKAGEVVTKKMFIYANPYSDGVNIFDFEFESRVKLGEVEIRFVMPEYQNPKLMKLALLENELNRTNEKFESQIISLNDQIKTLKSELEGE